MKSGEMTKNREDESGFGLISYISVILIMIHGCKTSVPWFGK